MSFMPRPAHSLHTFYPHSFASIFWTTEYLQAKIESIHAAVEDGDVRRTRSLIDQPKLALARDRKGATPLHNAVLYGQMDTVRHLLTKFPESVNAVDNVSPFSVWMILFRFEFCLSLFRPLFRSILYLNFLYIIFSCSLSYASFGSNPTSRTLPRFLGRKNSTPLRSSRQGRKSYDKTSSEGWCRCICGRHG